MNSYNSYVEYKEKSAYNIANIFEYIYSEKYVIEDISLMLSDLSDDIFFEDILNNDDLSNYLLIDDLYDCWYVKKLKNAQNPDGGFGLAEGYTSDIIDTKLALKALADLGESEAMTKAAMYIASLDSEEGTYKVKAEIVRSSNEEKV